MKKIVVMMVAFTTIGLGVLAAQNWKKSLSSVAEEVVKSPSKETLKNVVSDAAIKEFLNISGASETMTASINQMIELIGKNLPKTEKFKTILADIKTEVNGGSDELLNDLVPVYKKFLTSDDVKELIKLYENPVVQKLTKLQPKIAVESMKIGEEWGKKIGEKIQKKMLEQTK